MPLGKYHCDYCDKEFQDSPFARKRHLQDQNQVYAEGFGNGVCNRFVKTGICQYGDSCKYLHPKNTVQNLNNSQGRPGFVGSNQSPIFQGNQVIGTNSMSGDTVRDRMGISWGNLPPSLKPPPEGGYPSLPFVDWG
uniref:C3H1-type domain-containing protein n=1 Tax=Cannabis sativa TaxID=3483 RepID=A0A803PVX1_CANSA